MLPESFILAISLLLWVDQARASLSKPGCQERCGNVIVPYPYGIGPGCYLHKSFEVQCNISSQDHVPPLRFVHRDKLPILEISMEFVRVVRKSSVRCYASRSKSIAKTVQLDQHFSYSHKRNVSMEFVRVVRKPSVRCYASRSKSIAKTVQLDQHFSYSHKRNVYMAVGCNISAYFHVFGSSPYLVVGCDIYCLENPINGSMICDGSNGCCQSHLPVETRAYQADIYSFGTKVTCGNVFIAEKDHYPLPTLTDKKENIYHTPMTFNWVITLASCKQARQRGNYLCGQNSQCSDSIKGGGHTCHCMKGYIGNPYLPTGCQDINECRNQSNYSCKEDQFCINTHGSYRCTSQHGHISVILSIATVIGIFAFVSIVHWAYKVLGRRKENNIKQGFFKRNGGYLLKQHISANKSHVMKIKIYSAKVIEKATDGFIVTRLLGKGGQGTVYKGFLADGTIVAIKRSNVVDENEVERFVNEVFILSQINHRNIVRLLGCCLEYEVPLLVYEYLSNGTLSQHLHDAKEVSHFSWKNRIRVARDIARALAYLHSYASPAIFHRDVKPHNILLDENYRPVVCDFGLSRSIPLSRTHLTTKIEGTFGYLDPVYFQSGQLTEKSDVYAFGVVLTELLTRRKAVSSTRYGEGLAMCFRSLVKDNRVLEILDKQVLNEALMDDIVLVTKLAMTCMNKNVKKRPSMKEVGMDLDKLRVVQPELPS